MAHNPLIGKKKVIISFAVVIGAIVLALAVGMWLRNIQGKDKAAAPSSSSSSDTSIPVIKLSTETETADKLATSGKVNEANTYIAEQLAKPDRTDAQKYDLYSQQGLIAYNDGKLDAALDAYLKAEAVKQGQAISEAVADVARDLGKKDVAITYYKKAITQMDKNSPMYNSDKKSLEKRVTNLGGTL